MGFNFPLHFKPEIHTPRTLNCDNYVDTPVGGDVGVRVGVPPITKAPSAQIFLGRRVLFPRSLALDFCYDLDLCSQGQAVRAFFIKMGFP